MQYPARARIIPVFHVDIRLYAIGSTDRRRTDVHEKVMEITTMWGSLRLTPIIIPSKKGVGLYYVMGVYYVFYGTCTCKYSCVYQCWVIDVLVV